MYSVSLLTHCQTVLDCYWCKTHTVWFFHCCFSLSSTLLLQLFPGKQPCLLYPTWGWFSKFLFVCGHQSWCYGIWDWVYLLALQIKSFLPVHLPRYCDCYLSTHLLAPRILVLPSVNLCVCVCVCSCTHLLTGSASSARVIQLCPKPVET